MCLYISPSLPSPSSPTTNLIGVPDVPEVVVRSPPGAALGQGVLAVVQESNFGVPS